MVNNPARSHTSSWLKNRIKTEEIEKYLENGSDFIHDDMIEETLINAKQRPADPSYVRDLIAKAKDIKSLTPDETAVLLHVEDPELWQEMEHAGGEIKRKVYDKRIVSFAPLYLSTKCVNNCAYCGFRTQNRDMTRRVLTMDEIRREIEVLAGQIGHKRLIVVYGEHPDSDVDYMVDSLKCIYDVEAVTPRGTNAGIRRVNVNAAPLSIKDLARVNDAGIGTYQVFQETYHHESYRKLHPETTIKGHFQWRLYCMHRAYDAGINDVGIGALFGLYDWRFEVMALVTHACALEAFSGVGPHTVSFPRIEPAESAPYAEHSPYKVSDDDFRKLVVVLRLSIPYTGMILTARESAQMRRKLIPLGITQTDASTRIGIGAYSEQFDSEQYGDKQQFTLGDTRSLSEVIREYAEMGYITSFCTAGYRCGRTGETIMDLLKCGTEGHFCKLNAALTFREWLDDFADEDTKQIGEALIAKEIQEIEKQLPQAHSYFMDYYKKTMEGARDLYF
ncbi:[FeFe] hydrogenase H-cluster radical SAM maturase HydG [candidate division KSB3 bacterium]|uniref:[FeFe] hydrogenase H-cluster radical SAM maturase HydG n=1 Tax=candidate division KSB3 bacterium TaxID=2044937 RepID=A0A2G6E681_9BACT|nr:MAG: [FeFe] hydrogenase H-cluster radical SAM maturase HydG [candidate division KSB3 bacterium]